MFRIALYMQVAARTDRGNEEEKIEGRAGFSGEFCVRKSGRRVERLASSEGVGYSAVPDSEF
jgi:hypothetical protein